MNSIHRDDLINYDFTLGDNLFSDATFRVDFVTMDDGCEPFDEIYT